MKINWNKKYTTIALYACGILAATIIAVAFFVYLPSFSEAVGKFFEKLAPIFWGLAFAYLISPINSFFEKHTNFIWKKKDTTSSVKKIVCLVLTYISVTLVVFLFGLLIFPQIVSNYQAISENLANTLRLIYEWVQNFLYKSFDVTIDLSSGLESFISKLLSSSSTGSSVGSGLLNFVIGLLLSIFIIYHKNSLKSISKKILAAISPAKVFNFVMNTLKMADSVFGKFILGKVFDALIVGGIALVVLGFLQLPFLPSAVHIPYFLLITALICITKLIPYIGPVLGAVASILLVFTDDQGGFLQAIILSVIIIAINIVDSNVIGPKILGKSIGISSLWVVVSLIVLSSLMGVLGMFLAVPLFTIVFNLVKDFTDKKLKKKELPVDLEDYSTEETIVPDVLVRVTDDSSEDEQ